MSVLGVRAIFASISRCTYAHTPARRHTCPHVRTRAFVPAHVHACAVWSKVKMVFKDLDRSYAHYHSVCLHACMHVCTLKCFFRFFCEMHTRMNARYPRQFLQNTNHPLWDYANAVHVPEGAPGTLTRKQGPFFFAAVQNCRTKGAKKLLLPYNANCRLRAIKQKPAHRHMFARL